MSRHYLHVHAVRLSYLTNIDEISHVSLLIHLQTIIQQIIAIYSNLEMPRLSNENRARALGMLDCGKSQQYVARQFNVSRSTIARLVQRINTTGTLKDRQRSGAPRVTSIRQDNYIRQHHLRDRFLTAQSTSDMDIGNRGRTISRNTVLS